RKRVIRSKIVREGWMKDNGLNNVMELIKRQKWENLFKRSEFDWEAVINEAAEQGEFGSDDQFFYAQVEVEEPVTETPAAPSDPRTIHEFDEEAVMNKLQVEFERARANRFQADLEKAQAENARLLALLQQAQFKPKP
ncbi:hypothetical protein Dimus_005693, partial [Dionaea muscipula]